MSQKPSVGRIVLATVHPTTNNGTDIAPAVITRVWGDGLVNVQIFRDGASGSHPATSIGLYPNRKELDAAKARRDTEQPHLADTTFTAAYWPPRT